MELRRISGDDFVESFPSSHRGISNEFLLAALDLEVNTGFSVECPGPHYYSERASGGRYSCGTQNQIRRYARNNVHNWRTSHDNDRLQVFNAPSDFDMSFMYTVTYEELDDGIAPPKAKEISLDFIAEMEVKWESAFGSTAAVNHEIYEAMNHVAFDKRKDKQRYIETWLRRSAEWKRKGSKPAITRPISNPDIYKAEAERLRGDQ